MARPVSMRSCAWPAISAPWSQVIDRRGCSGSVVIVINDGIPYRLCAMAGERRAILGPGADAMAFYRRQVQEHRTAAAALNKGANG